jgi:hypothetical protein
MAANTTNSVIETAPLYGIDLTARDAILPHAAPAPVVIVPGDQLDANGVLATEKGAAEAVARWKSIGDYELPPLLDPAKPDLAGVRQALAHQSVKFLAGLQAAAEQRGVRDRGFQRKTLYATTTGEFRVPMNLPEQLRTGPFQPGAGFRAIVRFSSAGSKIQRDTAKDQRAAGIRVTDDQGRAQDLTFTSGAAGNHARDARQFNSSMRAAIDTINGGIGGKVKGLLGLLGREGFGETLRLVRARRSALDVGVSLAAMAYYSRSPLEMGGKLVHLALVPIEGTPAELVHEARAARDGLGRDMCMRRTAGEIRFRIMAAEAPPLDDLSRAPEGPWFTVGEIRLPRQTTGEAQMLGAAARIHAELAMHPFNVWGEGVLAPRGELNEILRKPVYSSSALNTGRNDAPPKTPQYRI